MDWHYINFKDERLIELKVGDLGLIIDSYKELFAKTPVIFLDEIQIIDGWEKFVRRLADTGYRLFVTGSNAKMLSKEIATTLGGRFIIWPVNWCWKIASSPVRLPQVTFFCEYLHLNKKFPGCFLLLFKLCILQPALQ